MIKYHDVVEDMRAIVAEKGRDYVYEAPIKLDRRTGEMGQTCEYFNDAGQPSCAVGHWLHRALGLNDVGVLEGKTAKEILTGGHRVIADEIEDRAVTFLDLFQWRQDLEDPWGEAFDQAIAEVEGR